MKNFLTESLLYVNIFQILFVGEVRTTRSIARINLLLISKNNKLFTLFFTCVLKISNHFIHFSLRNGELNVKNIKTFSKERNCVFFLLRKIMNG